MGKSSEKKELALAKLPMTLYMLHMSVYLISGVAQPLLVSVLRRAGFGNWKTMLFQLTNYISELSLFAIPVPEKYKNGHMPLWQRIVLGLIDCTSLAACIVGNTLAGSAIYAIIYSTVSIWTALESWLFLSIRLNLIQWLGIIVGVASALVTIHAANADSSDALWGAIIILLGSIGHGITYVAGAALPSTNAIAPSRVSGWFGIVGTAELSILFLGLCLPNIDSVLIKPVQEAGWGVGTIVGLFIALFVADALHAFSFFVALSSAGPVMMAVLKTLTAGLVCAVAGLTPLCDAQHQSECFTWEKGLSLGLACVAIGIYVAGTEYGKRRAAAAEAPLLAEESTSVHSESDASEQI